MSWLDRAKPRNKRRATNFIHEVAQRRLEEQLPAFQNKIGNALRVDSVEVIVFKQTKIGLPCSCGSTENSELGYEETVDDSVVSPEENVVQSQTTAAHGSKGSKVTFDLGSDSVFGEGTYDRDIQQTGTLREPIELGDMFERTEAVLEGHVVERVDYDDTELIGNSDVCGICYKTGYQPPFELVNYKFALLSHYNIEDVYGYYADRSRKPQAFVRQDDKGYVEYSLVVPKYFTEVWYSIRNDTDIYGGIEFLRTNSGEKITRAYIDQHRGREMLVRVCAQEYTHVSLFFKLIDEPVHGNISEEQDVINYENESTIGDLTVILPHTVGSIRSGDMLIIPKRNLVLKVNGAPRKTTADKQVWEWSVTARAVQRSEMTSNIFKSFKIW